MAEARKWLHQIEVQKAEAKEKKVVFKNEGIRLVDVAVRYGISENVVEGAEISAPKKEYKASALDYKQLNELIYEATTMEDPSFLYLVVMSMT